jgi:hypothetical protein
MTKIELHVAAADIDVRNAARFLNGLALMRDGLTLLEGGGVNPYAQKLHAQFPELFLSADDALDLLRGMGSIVVDDHNWPVLPDQQEVLITAALLKVSEEEKGLQLQNLTRGSLDGVFEDLFDKIGKLLRDLLQTSNSVVGGGEGKEMKSTLRKTLENSGKTREVQVVSAGVFMMGAEKYKKGLAAMNATKVEVL